MPDTPDGPGLTMLPRGAAGSPAVPAAARPSLARRGWASARGRLDGPARKVLRACAARPGAAGAVVLAAWYLWCYLGDRSLPGNDPRYPLGWWGWWDQGKYIESARALAAGALAPDRHWYPLGYSLMGAPFTRWSQGHPMLPVNLASLLLCYAGFLAFARRVGVGRGWAAALFLAAAAGSRMLFEGWIVPWSTTPAAALIWLLLATAAGHMQGARRPFLVGLLAAAIPLVRPTELVLAVPCVLAVIASDLWRPPARGQPAGNGRPEDGNLRGGWVRARWARDGWAWDRRVRDLGLLALGGLLAVVPYGLLHWRIYGLEPSPYMAMSTGVGFTLHGFGWKAYTVLSDPRAWFLDGRGLLWRAPYAALALAGLAVAWAHGRAAALVAALTVVHSVLYLSYADLLPTGLWRFSNAHYWQWALPGLALLAFLVGRDLLRWRRAPLFPLAPVAVAASLLLLCARVEPVEVAAGVPAKMLAYAGPPPGFDAAYFTELALRDSVGEMRGFGELRAIPVPGGMRVYALRRSFGDDPAWVVPPPGWAGDAAPVRYGMEWRLGVPCWTRLVACKKLGQSFLPREPEF